MDDNEFQDFAKKYGEETVLNGYAEFEKFAAKRKKTFEDLKAEKIKADINYAQFNKDFHTSRSFDYEGHLKHKTEQLSSEEIEVAKRFGYKEKEQTAKEGFAEFKKQFEQQIQEKKADKNLAQQEQFADFKKDSSKDGDKNEKLDDKEKQQSANQPLDREKLRADFLEKMKQTKQQISQRQQDQGQEHV